MKAMCRIATVVLAAAGLSACATMDESSANLSTLSDPSEAGTIGTDKAYMARVEEIARRRGIQVTWVNPPVVRPDERVASD